jgi:hypothetical protein
MSQKATNLLAGKLPQHNLQADPWTRVEAQIRQLEVCNPIVVVLLVLKRHMVIDGGTSDSFFQ